MSLTSRFSSGDGETKAGREFRAEEAARIAKPINEATEKLRKSHGALIAEQARLDLQTKQNELKQRLTTQPSDFRTEPCTLTEGVPEAVSAVYEIFKTEVNETEGELVVAFLRANADRIDCTRIENWRAAFDYIDAAYAALEPVATVEPVVEVAVSTSKFPEQDKLIASLQSELDALPVGNSRARENLERRIHAESVKAELLSDDSSRAILQEISDQSGLLISSSVALQFKAYAASPVARRRFGSDRTGTRLCFCEFTGNDSFLTPEEKALVGNYRAIENMTADEVAAQTGRNRSYASNPHSGIRQP